MNYKKSSEVSEEILDKIISVAYGNASIVDRILVRRLIKKDSQLQKMFEEYQLTANAVHSIKLEEYKTPKKSVVMKSNRKGSTLMEEIYSIFLGRPIVYSTAITVLFVAIMFSVFSNREISYNGYTLAEVEKANRESKLALSIVADIFDDTGKILKTDILYNEVSKPINEGINTVNKLFKKEMNK
ncbi:MAG: hypothetical protein ABFS12_01075 [Bacteroidota bacterium]